ncbi:MAG: exopolyphosphatase [Alphaproteobacteria bacterium]|nr:exopolyphosphatase [Alphaproteobacteria bacterium]MDP6516500.1 exopolyphosphatase [Alphaproteobacteria bacterium]
MTMAKYRLITRRDLDGLVCAMLLKELDLVEDIVFVHPKDVQDGKVEVTANDITANVPYVPGAHLAFDHHYSEMLRNVGTEDPHYINIPNAPSAARVIYDYYGGRERFPKMGQDLMASVDRADAAKFTKPQVLNESGWDLLSFILDPRTGLERFANFAIPHDDFVVQLIDYCRGHTIDEIMALPAVEERVELYRAQRQQAEHQIKTCATVHNKVVVIDFRDQDTIYCANRFLVYAMFPTCNLSIHALRGPNPDTIVFAIGKSIFNRSSRIDIDQLTLSYGGGGHEAVGTCQVPTDQAERVLGELIERIRRTG